MLLFEEFVKYDKLYDIIKQIENRVNYWFSDGELSKDTNLIDVETTVTDKYSKRSVMFTFSNDNYIYQCFLTVASDNGDKCHVTLKRYDIDEQKLIDKVQEEVDLSDVNSDLIISKISDMEEKGKKNPDDVKIAVQKEKDKEKNDTGDESGNNDNNNDMSNFELGGAGTEEEEYPQEEEAGGGNFEF